MTWTSSDKCATHQQSCSSSKYSKLCCWRQPTASWAFVDISICARPQQPKYVDQRVRYIAAPHIRLKYLLYLCGCCTNKNANSKILNPLLDQISPRFPEVGAGNKSTRCPISCISKLNGRLSLKRSNNFMCTTTVHDANMLHRLA